MDRILADGLKERFEIIGMIRIISKHREGNRINIDQILN